MAGASGIETAAGSSTLIREALEMAGRSHSGQVRSGSGGLPYIEHPVAVAEVVLDLGLPEEVVAAALLHDVVEDSEASVEDVRALAGDRVAELVGVLSDDPSIEDYAERKREHRQRVAAGGPEALAVYAADKLTNVGMLRGTYASKGEEVAVELKAPLDEKIEAWRLDCEMLAAKAEAGTPVSDLADRLAEELRRLRDDRAASAGPRHLRD